VTVPNESDETAKDDSTSYCIAKKTPIQYMLKSR